MAHAFTAHLRKRNFDAAFFADHTTMFEALVLAAQAFIVFDRAKNLGAKQTITLRLEGAVVDCFRLFDFTERPRANPLGRGEANLNGVKLNVRGRLFEQV